MHQLGLSAAEVALLLQQQTETQDQRLETLEAAALNAGLAPELAKRQAMLQYMNEFTTSLLEANNRKIAADLIRLGVLTGTITRDGEPAF